jgi:hypothetical protein
VASVFRAELHDDRSWHDSDLRRRLLWRCYWRHSGHPPPALEQRTSRIEAELVRVSAKVDEMHAVLMQAKGVRWAVVAVAGVVGFVTGVSHWLISKG